MILQQKLTQYRKKQKFNTFVALLYFYIYLRDDIWPSNFPVFHISFLCVFKENSLKNNWASLLIFVPWHILSLFSLMLYLYLTLRLPLYLSVSPPVSLYPYILFCFYIFLYLLFISYIFLYFPFSCPVLHSTRKYITKSIKLFHYIYIYH